MQNAMTKKVNFFSTGRYILQIIYSDRSEGGGGGFYFAKK